MSGYIGTQPVPQATQTRDVFTATSGQTSFATSGYTPNFLDVWLNGVKLVNGDDFTATNGSDVVLTNGATAGDTVEVLSYSTFEVADRNFTGDTSAENFTVTGTFTSRGIDDNATSTAVTLDASGNLLVGKTVVGTTNAGMYVTPSGQLGVTNVNAASASANIVCRRDTQDGKFINFTKDGTTVGSIGSVSGATAYIDGGSGFSGIQFGGDGLVPRDNGALADNTSDLGTSSYRFRNAYLSGGVYLGGTGAANLLDDYEEGTWTPSFTNGSGVVHDVQVGTYTKIGNIVYLEFVIGTSTLTPSVNGIRIGGLPFTQNATSNSVSSKGMFESIYLNFDSAKMYSLGISSGEITLREDASGTGNSSLTYNDVQSLGNFEIRGSIQYRAI